jgi:hypothetical protein
MERRQGGGIRTPSNLGEPLQGLNLPEASIRAGAASSKVQNTTLSQGARTTNAVRLLPISSVASGLRDLLDGRGGRGQHQLSRAFRRPPTARAGFGT